MRLFTDKDISSWDSSVDGHKMYRISADRDELIDAPMWFHLKGLQETRSGYGSRLNSGMKINFNGRLYRLYVTIFSNSGTMWFKSQGQTIIVG